MARIFTAGNELAEPLDEGWYWDETNNVGYGSVNQRNGPRTAESNGGNWYYLLAQNYDLKHFPGYFGRPPSFPIADTFSELYVRFHYYGAAYVSGERAILSFVGGDNSTYFTLAVYDSATSTTSGNPAGIRFRENTTGTAHIQAASVFINNVWNLFEVRLKLGGGGTGVAEIRVNEVVVGSVTTTLLGPALQTQMAGIHMRCRQNGGTNRSNYYDNFAVNDTTGTVNNSWPGEGFVVLRQPQRDGTTTQLTTDERTSGVDNADRIGSDDRRLPSRDTIGSTGAGWGTGDKTIVHSGFVYPTAVPQKDTYTVDQLPFDAGAIHAISTFSRARGRTPLSTNVRHLITPPAQSEIQTPQLGIPATVPGPQAHHFNENPNTSVAFTVNEVNNMELGIQFEA